MNNDIQKKLITLTLIALVLSQPSYASAPTHVPNSSSGYATLLASTTCGLLAAWGLYKATKYLIGRYYPGSPEDQHEAHNQNQPEKDGSSGIATAVLDTNLKEQFGEQITFAAKQGHYRNVHWLLQQYASPNVQDATGMTPLMYAICSGSSETVTVLLKFQADINIQDNNGHTAFAHAIIKGHDAIAQLLISHNKFQPYYADDAGRTPLILAAQHGNNEELIRRFLLNPHFAHLFQHTSLRNGDRYVNARDNQGNTALIVALQKKSIKTAILLLDVGANPNIVDQAERKSPLMWAVQAGSLQAVKELLKRRLSHNTVNAHDRAGNTPLLLALGHKHQEIANKLINAGADITIHTPNEQNTPLHLAAQFNLPEVARNLLAKGADTNVRNSDGNTAYDIAKQYEHDDITQMICNYNPGSGGFKHAIRSNDINAATLILEKDPTIVGDGTLLQHAARHRRHQIARLLLQAKSPVDAVDKNGMTPVMHAACCGSKKTIMECIKHEANLALQDKSGKTALLHAIEARHPKTTKYLISHHPALINHADKQGKTPLMYAAAHNQNKAIQSLLEHPNTEIVEVDINACDHTGKTALIHAIQAGNTNGASMLLNKGASARMSDDIEHKTALMWASQHGQLPIVQQILQQKPPASLLEYDDCSGNTALLLALINKKPTIAEALIHAESEVNICTSGNHRTPLHLAAQHNFPKVARSLLRKGANKSARDRFGHTAAELAEQHGYHAIKNLLLEQGGIS